MGWTNSSPPSLPPTASHPIKMAPSPQQHQARLELGYSEGRQGVRKRNEPQENFTVDLTDVAYRDPTTVWGPTAVLNAASDR